MDRSSNDTDGRISLSAVGLSHDAEALIAHISSLGITVDAKRGSVGGQIRRPMTKLVGQFLEDDMPESCRAIYPTPFSERSWDVVGDHSTLHRRFPRCRTAQKRDLPGDARLARRPSQCRTPRTLLDARTLEHSMGSVTEPVLELMRRADDLFG